MYLLYKRTLYNFIFSGLPNPGLLQPACNIIWLRGKDKWRVSYCCNLIMLPWCFDVMVSCCLDIFKYCSQMPWFLATLLLISCKISLLTLLYAVIFCHSLSVVLGYNKQHQYFILGATLATASGIKLQSVNHLFTCIEYIHSRAACFFPFPCYINCLNTASTARAAATVLQEIN